MSLRNILFTTSCIIAVGLSSVFTAQQADAGAVGGGVLNVLNYYEKALSAVGESLGTSVAAEQNVYSQQISSWAEVLDFVPDLSSSDDALKTSAEKLANDKTIQGTQYLSNSGPVTSSINGFSAAVSALNIVFGVKKVFTDATKADKLSREIARLVKSGDSDSVDAIISSIRSGKMLYDMSGNTAGLNAEMSQIIETYVQAKNPDLATGLLVNAAKITTTEYQTFLAKNDYSVRVFLAQEALIAYELSKGNESGLIGQKVYALNTTPRKLFSDIVKMDDGNSFTIQPADDFVSFEQELRVADKSDVEQLQTLLIKFQNYGGLPNVDKFNATKEVALDLVKLGKLIDPELEGYGNDEVIRRLFVNLPGYEDKFYVSNIDVPKPNLNPFADLRDLTPIPILTIPDGFDEDDETTWGNPPALVDSEDDEQLSFVPDTSEIPPPIADNDRTDDEKEEVVAELDPTPVGPTPEEIAAAVEKAARITALEIERTAQFEIKVDREANIRNNDNRLAILEFGEQETVQNALSLVTSRVNDMRQDLIAGNLNAEQQQLFQDLAAYQETLEGEIDRVNTEITTLTNTNQTLQSELDSANTTIINNSDQLNALNYDYNNFTEPTFTGSLPDYSDAGYELPPFNETVTPTGNLVGVFSGVNYGTNGAIGSNLAIQGVLTNITETSAGNASFEITGDCVSGCTVTATTPESEASSYTYLSWGRLSQTVRMTDSSTGITHDIQNMRWLYGDATSLDYLNTRTGAASYAGQIYGDLTEGGVTQYNTITGGIGLSFNFSDDSLSGQAYFSQGGVPQEGFDIAGGVISSDGQQHLQATLTSQDPNLDTDGSATSGGLLGTFYGPEASEVGGAIWAFSSGGMYDEAFAVAGVFVASSGETFVMPNISYDDDTHTRITTNKIGYGVYDTDTNSSGQDILGIPARVGGGSITKTETFSASGYSYSSWGKWTAGAGNSNPDYAQGGYWAETQTTPASVVQNRTGTASYSGNIVGDFVSSTGVRDDARGLINIAADFSNHSVSGQFQFGHDCGGSGSGPSGCGVVSSVANFNEAINDYNGSGFGNHSDAARTTGSGIVGIFAGPNAEEIAGTVWANDNGGMYNGAFVAGHDIK